MKPKKCTERLKAAFPVKQTNKQTENSDTDGEMWINTSLYSRNLLPVLFVLEAGESVGRA